MTSKIISITIFSLVCCLFFAHATNTDCVPRETEYGSVCVCTASYCDYLENPQPSDDNVVVISSSKAGQRFNVSNLRFGENNDTESSAVIGRLKITQLLVNATRRLFGLNNPIQVNINRSVEYQKITGFGGALTGSVSYLLGLLDTALQDHIYKSYYHKDGLGFNLLRTSIGGCDFDLEPWAYNELPENDAILSNFTQLDPRDELKIQQIEKLKSVSNLSDLKIMAAAWSPPLWMKSNGEWSGFSSLKEEYYQTWADYHLRFIQLMDAKNMSIWAISTGNEPTDGNWVSLFVRFMSLGWSAKNQAIWLNDFLGPTIRNSTYKDVMIFGSDDQRYSYPIWFDQMESSRQGVMDYLNGFAVHFYWDEFISANFMDKTVEKYPGRILLNTESCIGDKPWQTHGPELGSWDRGDKYAKIFLNNLQHSYNGWIDWNIVLDEQGGPNYAKNYVDAAVIVNATNRVEIYKQPIYYAMGHFSKFVPAGSVRIQAEIQKLLPQIDVVAFKRPDNRIAAVLLNSDNDATDVVLNDSAQGEIKINIPANSWHTIIYN